MKRLMHILMLCLVAGAWLWFSNTGKKADTLETQKEELLELGDPDNKVGSIDEQLSGVRGERILTGVLLTFLSAGLVGIFFVVYLLPFFAQRVTHAVYDSAEMVEKDVMHDARSLLAQGDYAGAIAAFQEAAKADPLNRLPWVEIAKIYRDNLHNPAAAIQTIRHALESQEWQVSDAAFFLFRLAEMYDVHEGDRLNARAIMQQVVDEFPETRHSANAKHRLHEWDVEEEEAARHAQEQEYLAGAGGAANPELPGSETRYELPPSDDDA